MLKVRIPRAPRAIEGETADVSRHGVYVQSDRAVPQRQLLQVELFVPDEPLPVPMMAMVTRVASQEDGSPAGFALDFYALEKGSLEAWERFVSHLEGEAGHKGIRSRSTGSMPATGPRLGLKVSTVDRLIEIYLSGIQKGELWLPAGKTRAKGQRLEISLVHPKTREQFSIFGEVKGKEKTPLGDSGLKIKLFKMSNSAETKLLDFIAAGDQAVMRKLRRRGS